MRTGYGDHSTVHHWSSIHKWRKHAADYDARAAVILQKENQQKSEMMRGLMVGGLFSTVAKLFKRMEDGSVDSSWNPQNWKPHDLYWVLATLDCLTDFTRKGAWDVNGINNPNLNFHVAIMMILDKLKEKNANPFIVTTESLKRSLPAAAPGLEANGNGASELR